MVLHLLSSPSIDPFQQQKFCPGKQIVTMYPNRCSEVCVWIYISHLYIYAHIYKVTLYVYICVYIVCAGFVSIYIFRYVYLYLSISIIYVGIHPKHIFRHVHTYTCLYTQMFHLSGIWVAYYISILSMRTHTYTYSCVCT